MAIVSRQSEYGAQFEPTRFGWSPRRSSGLVSRLADVDQSLPEISDGNRRDVLGSRTQNEAAEVLGDSSKGQNQEINAPSPQAGGWNPDTANTPSHWLQQAAQAVEAKLNISVTELSSAKGLLQAETDAKYKLQEAMDDVSAKFAQEAASHNETKDLSRAQLEDAKLTIDRYGK